MAQHPAHSQDQRHPDEPRSDEIVAALKGAQFPIILRSNGDHWIVVGESYIHGIMTGKRYDEMTSGRDCNLESKTFEIR